MVSVGIITVEPEFEGFGEGQRKRDRYEEHGDGQDALSAIVGEPHALSLRFGWTACATSKGGQIFVPARQTFA